MAPKDAEDQTRKDNGRTTVPTEKREEYEVDVWVTAMILFYILIVVDYLIFWQKSKSGSS